MLIEKPTFIINEAVCKRNIASMAEKARNSGVQFRPHFKTHQSAEVGKWFREAGVEKITVSSVDMALYFAKHGWKDITIALPVNVYEIDKINQLAEQIQLAILVDHLESAKYIRDFVHSGLGVFIKIDIGNHRCGILPDNILGISGVLQELDKNKNLCFKGFLGHAGHAYQATSAEEVKAIHHESVRIMKGLKQVYSAKYSGIISSLGDTPTASIVEDHSGVDEIRPGNFVFYDAMQWKLGVCDYSDIAGFVACPVISKSEERGELVVYGGAVHLSKEFLLDENGQKVYGYVRLLNQGTNALAEGACLKALYQEHGVVKADRTLFNKIKLGDMLGIVPVHSCLTVAAMKGYVTNKGKVINTWNAE